MGSTMLRKMVLATIASLAFIGTAVAAPAIPDYVKTAVADSNRPAADTALDADRKPAESVAFAGIKPGDTVAELLPGGGYFTRILSKVVGPTGHVYAFQPMGGMGKPGMKRPIDEIAADPAYGNVTVISKPLDDFATPVKVDYVWTSDNYHDMHNPQMHTDVAKLDKAVYDALKPGGIYMIIDHAAKAGAGTSDTNTLHRIDPEVAKTETAAAGFKFAGQSDVLRNPNDDHTLKIFDPKIRHHTDQFIFKFQKPAS